MEVIHGNVHYGILIYYIYVRCYITCLTGASRPKDVRKKDGTDRFCVDYSRLNAVTKKDSYPLPYIQDMLDVPHGAKYFSIIDVASGTRWICTLW